MSILRRAAVAAVVALLCTQPASAAYHIMTIEEVFFGTEDCPNAQYVMLRQRADMQNFVGNQSIRNQGADGTAADNFGTFAMRVQNDDSGDTILMGTAEAESLFGIQMDQETTGRLLFDDGRICFGLFAGQVVDCVAYGDFTGENPGGGSPAPAAALGMALVRAADTANDGEDFDLGAPMPQNNAGQTGTLGSACIAPPTPTPTTQPITPTPTQPQTSGGCPGDCNEDGEVFVNELVTGVNILLEVEEASKCLAMDRNNNGGVEVNELVSAVNSVLLGCPDLGNLGVRHFTINPNTSPFTAVVRNVGDFPNLGFEGFIDLRAGMPDANGLVLVDIVDTSEYLSVLVPAQSGGSDLAICIHPNRDLLPLVPAGAMDCDGGSPLGISVVQDHNLGMVGTCAGGSSAGSDCTTTEDCTGGTCFTEEACTTMGGTVETPDLQHPGVCRGPLVGSTLPGDSGPGALVIAQGNGLLGLPATLTMETGLPCGDEDVPATETTFAFTTGAARAEILNQNTQPNVSFSDSLTGQNFSCQTWSQENSNGTLVLGVPTFDVDLPILGPSDIISQFTFDD